MNLRYLGILGLMIGVSILSLECFLLRMLQMLEKTTGSWYLNLSAYLQEPIILLSFVLIIGVIIASIICIIWEWNSHKK